MAVCQRSDAAATALGLVAWMVGIDLGLGATGAGYGIAHITFSASSALFTTNRGASDQIL